MNFARNSLNRHSRENGNPVPDQVEDKHFQLVIDSRAFAEMTGREHLSKDLRFRGSPKFGKMPVTIKKKGIWKKNLTLGAGAIRNFWKAITLNLRRA